MQIEPTTSELRPWMNGRSFNLIIEQKEFDDLIDRIIELKRYGIDTETNGLHPINSRVVGICLAPSPQEGFYIPIRHELGKNLDLKVAIAGMKRLQQSEKKADFWNARFDINMFMNDEVVFDNFRNINDGMIMYWLIDSARRTLKLKYVAKAEKGYEMLELWECFGHAKKPRNFVPTVQTLDPLRVTVYGCSDSMITTELCRVFEKDSWIERQAGVYQLELATIMSLVDMDRQKPMKLDMDYVLQWKSKIESKLLDIEKQVYDLVGHPFNIGSPDQLGKVLYQDLGLPVIATTGSGNKPSTGDEVLESLKSRHPAVALVQDWRHNSKLMSTYLEPFLVGQENGYTRINFFQPATETGRIQGRAGNFELDGTLGMSVSTIPKNREGRDDIYDPRRVFVADEGYVLAAVDYENEEMRLAANMSGEPVWIDALNSGRNMHREMGSRMYKKEPQALSDDEYAIAKGANFRYLYGGGSPREEEYNIYYAAVPTLKAWQDKMKEQMSNYGFVTTAWGRCRRADELIRSGDRAKIAYALRQSVNSPVQGTGSDVLRLALTQIVLRLLRKEYPELRGKVKVRLLVHDEIVYEIPLKIEGTDWTWDKILYKICEIMESVKIPHWKCPLRVDGHIGPSWSSITGTKFKLDRDRKVIVLQEKKVKKDPLKYSNGEVKYRLQDNHLILKISSTLLTSEFKQDLKNLFLDFGVKSGSRVTVSIDGGSSVTSPGEFDHDPLIKKLATFVKISPE